MVSRDVNPLGSYLSSYRQILAGGALGDGRVIDERKERKAVGHPQILRRIIYTFIGNYISEYVK